MKNFIQKLKGDRAKREKLGLLLCVLSLVVACGVFWQLRITGITMSDVPCCGMEEHTHDESCVERRLICGFDDAVQKTQGPQLVCTQSEHTHSDACYEITRELVCPLEEHTHGDGCYETRQVLACEEEHDHTEECWQEQQVLICELGHSHEDGCYEIHKDLLCTEEEHTHGEACYVYPETQETEPPHVHTDACYENVYACGFAEEHVHTLACYSDPKADIETPSVWESTLPDLTGKWVEDLCAVAKSQVGVEESDNNFILAENSTQRLGITRYGQWYGNPYGPWDAMFATFCLRYAGIQERFIPGNSGCYAWTAQLSQKGILLDPADHRAEPGDLVFFDLDDDDRADHVGIVLEAGETNFIAVEGGRNGRVDQYSYHYNEETLYGFVSVAQEYEKQLPAETAPETEPAEETVPETTEETLPEEPSIPVAIFEDETFQVPVEGAAAMTVTSELPEGAQVRAWLTQDFPDDLLWAFHIGLYAEDGTLMENESFTLTVALPQLLDEGSTELKIYRLTEDAKEEVPAETDGEHLTFEASSGSLYGAARMEEEPQQIQLPVALYTDETYLEPIEGGPAFFVTGDLPEDAQVRAYPAQVQLDTVEVLWAFHIGVFDADGNPMAEPPALTVSMELPQTYSEQPQELNIYQIPVPGEETQVPSVLDGQTLTFQAAKPAVYAAAVPLATAAEEALRSAIQGETSYMLTEDIEIVNGPLEINKKFTLDLNGRTLTGPQFHVVADGTLIITDSVPANDVFQNQGAVNWTGAGHVADYQTESRSLSYYVTQTSLLDLPDGLTKEELVHHTVNISGQIAAGSITVDGGGAFVLSDGAITEYAGIAVTANEGSSVTLAGGYICGGNTAVHASGATVTMSGGVLAANADSAIRLDNGSQFEMSGGVISGNQGALGAGVQCIKSTAEMSGGYITNNRTDANDTYSGGSGFYLKGPNTSLDLSGGACITGNYAPSGGAIQTYNGDNMSNQINMTMKGGIISSNYAFLSEGGGIALRAAVTATITGGHITNNGTGTVNDWGGGGVFCSEQATLQIYNALVADNHAECFGGGVTGCSTGTVLIGGNEGVAIYGNVAVGDPAHLNHGNKHEAEAAFDDVNFMRGGYNDYFCALYSSVNGKMLGGGDALWYGSADGKPLSPDSFDPAVTAYIRMGLTSRATPAAREAAYQAAHVFISGNFSNTHGGGVLCNGLIMFGSDFEDITVEKGAELPLTGKKNLLDTDGEYFGFEAGIFHFEIREADQYGTPGDLVATGTNVEKVLGGWNDKNPVSINFDSPLYFPTGGTYYFVIQETACDNPTILIDPQKYFLKVELKDESETTENHITTVQWMITSKELFKMEADNSLESLGSNEIETKLQFVNQIPEKTDIKVEKLWNDVGPHESITVHLVKKEDGSTVETVTLSEGNWSHKWEDLEVVEGGYDVIEENVLGYTSVVSVVNNGVAGFPGLTPAPSPVDGGQYYIGLETMDFFIAYADGNFSLKKLANISNPAQPLFTLVDAGNGKFSMKVVGADKYLSIVQGPYDGDRPALEPSSFPSKFTIDNGVFKGEVIDKNTGVEKSITQYLDAVIEGSGDWASARFILSTEPPNHSFHFYSYGLPDGVGTGDVTFTITNTPVVKEKSYDFTINKVAAEDPEKFLPGAEFRLSRDGTYLSFTKESDETYVYQPDGAEGVADDPTILVTGEGGKLHVSGLPAGTYTLTETKAPDGYSFTPGKSITITLPDDDEDPVWIVENDLMYFELPQTGGTGTYGFTLLGLLMMSASGGLWIHMQKRKREGGSAF